MYLKHFSALCLSVFSLGAIVACDSSSESRTTSTPLPPTGGSTTTTTSARIDPDFQPYLDTFVSEASKRGISVDVSTVIIQYGTLPANTLGVCEVQTGGIITQPPKVTINEIVRGQNNEFTVIHELGHCILRMEHRDNVLSIMNTAENNALLNTISREALFDEFFTVSLFNQF